MQAAELALALDDPALCADLLRGSTIDAGRLSPARGTVPAALLLIAHTPPGVLPQALDRSRIQRLDFAGLTETLPDAFDRFPALRWLDLSHTGATVLPPSLAGHPSLTGLVARGNALSSLGGPIPGLRFLDASQNRLREIPAWLADADTLCFDANDIAQVPAGLRCRHLSLVANPLRPPLTGDDVIVVGSPEFVARGPARTGSVWLGTEPPPPPHPRAVLRFRDEAIDITWEESEQRWFVTGSLRDRCVAQEAAGPLRRFLTAAPSVLRSVTFPGQPAAERPLTDALHRAVLLRRAEQQTWCEALAPEVQRLFSEIRDALPAQTERLHGLGGDALHTELSVLCGLQSQQRAWEIAGLEAAGQPIPQRMWLHGDVMVAIYDDFQELWTPLAPICGPAPAEEVARLVDAAAGLGALEAYLYADLLTAVVSVWSEPQPRA